MTIKRSQIVSALGDQGFELPDYSTLHEGWHLAVSPHLDWLRQQASCILKKIIYQRHHEIDMDCSLRKLEGTDFGFFIATWWPYASPKTLLLMLQMAIWVFLWDDEIDAEDTLLGNDLESAHLYREQTLQFIAHSLGLSRNKPSSDTFSILITNFQSIAERVRHLSHPYRFRLFSEIELYVKATEVEQHQRVEGSLPSLQRYMQCRMATSAVGVIFALFETPTPIFDNAPVCNLMRTMEHEVNIMISITNDILSLRKELADGAPDTIIPILWLSNGSIEESINIATGIMQEARSRFDKAEAELIEICPYAYIDCIKDFADICKTNCTGNLEWSLKTKRYGIRMAESKTANRMVLS